MREHETNETFRKIFHRWKVSQQKFGELIDLDKHSVHDWLKNKNEMRFTKLLEVAEKVNVKLKILIIMKYRVIKNENDGSLDIITSDGGVCSFYHNEENFVTSYYQRRLTDCNQFNYVWDELSEDKVYMKDWEGEPTEEEVVKDALEWLVYPQPDSWEVDDTLFEEFFK